MKQVVQAMQEASIQRKADFGLQQITNWLQRFDTNELYELLMQEIVSRHGHQTISKAHSKFNTYPYPQFPTLEQMNQNLQAQMGSYADGILRRLPQELLLVVLTKDPEKIYQFTLNAKAAADWIVRKASPEQQQREQKTWQRNQRLHKALVPKQVMPSY